jgi:hypothetical protein
MKKNNLGFFSYPPLPNDPTAKSPPRTGTRAPPVRQTLGFDDPPEGWSLVTDRPLQKKNIDTSVRSTVQRDAQ